MKKSRLSAAVTAVLAAAPLALSAAPASAAGSCNLYAPSRVSIVSPYREIRVSFSSGCASATDAYWTALHPSQGYQTAVFYPDDYYFALYDFDDRGTWRWNPEGAWGYNDQELTQNMPYTDIRLGSRADISATRSGSKVSFYTRTQRYAYSVSAFVAYRPNPVALLQRQKPGTTTWSSIKYLYPDSAGVYRYSYSYSTRANYRVLVRDAAGIWGSNSRTITL
ncbi:MAG: hypothetical protein LWW86_02465 [Micrococcales bacterium]|nr:hypothetical protein [Micrococcales bacterium]